MKNPDKIVIHVDPEIKEIIPLFLKHREEDLNAIAQALKTNDFESARRLGHQMKGAGGGYGFEGITKIGADLEVRAKEGDSAGVQKALDDLSDYLQRLVIIDE